MQRLFRLTGSSDSVMSPCTVSKGPQLRQIFSPKAPCTVFEGTAFDNFCPMYSNTHDIERCHGQQKQYLISIQPYLRTHTPKNFLQISLEVSHILLPNGFQVKGAVAP